MPIIVTAYRYINNITYDDNDINSYTVVSLQYMRVMVNKFSYYSPF